MAKQPTTKAKKKTMQQAAPFASLMGIHLEDQRKEDEEQARRAEQEKEWAKKAETDPDREQMEDESDDDYATRMEELDKEEEAEGEIKEEPEAEDEKDDEKAKAIRASERARCARIIAEGIKANNVHQAAVFAFDTNLTSSQAISAMAAAKMSTPSGGLGSRMQGVQSHNLGSNAGTNPVTARDKSTAQANSILASVEAARGKDK